LARAVGLDIGARHVRLVEVEASGRGLRVLRLGERDCIVPEGADREEAVREAVDSLFKDTKASRDEVVLAWPAETCTIREISVPFRETDQIRRVVKYEFESHLHAQAIEDVVVDFVAVADTKEGKRLLAVAAPKGPLRARLEALAKAKVDPVAVDTDLMALATAASAAGLLAENPDCVLVDIGSRSTKIIVIREGRVRAARALLGGFDASSDAPAAPEPGEGLAPADAPASTATAVAVHGDRVSAAATRIVREVSRTIASAAPGVVFPVVFVSGRGSVAPGAREVLASGLGIEVRPLDVLGRSVHPVPAEQIEETGAAFATAIGAGAHALGIGPDLMDLRREDLAYARRFDQVKGGIAAVLALLLLAVGFLLWRTKNEKEAANAEFGKMIARLTQTSEAAEKEYRAALGEDLAKKLRPPSGREVDAVPDARIRVKQMNDYLHNELGISTEVPLIRSSLEVLKSVHEAIKSVREQLDYCLVTKTEISQKEVQINILVSASEHADILKKAFQKAKTREGALLFPDDKCVEYGPMAQDKRGKYPVPFTLRFEAKK
jgi:Tfp pilus assembly PilM family ATPase